MFAGGVVHLAQQQAATIAQLGVVGAELMPGIDHRPGLRFGPQLVPAEQLGEHRAFGGLGGQVQQRHGRRAGHHQAWMVDRLGQYMG